MSDLPETLKKLKYDKRMVNWNLRQKLLTEKEYKKHLTGLKDLSHLKAKSLPPEEKTDKDKAENNKGNTDPS